LNREINISQTPRADVPKKHMEVPNILSDPANAIMTELFELRIAHATFIVRPNSNH
jgi:hypothetical protein